MSPPPALHLGMDDGDDLSGCVPPLLSPPIVDDALAGMTSSHSQALSSLVDDVHGDGVGELLGDFMPSLAGKGTLV